MGESKKKASTWMTGAVYLSIAAFIAKGLSALYKVPYQNVTGDFGYYIYQQIYPLYGVIFVLGTYGFPLVISKILVQREDTPIARRNRIIALTIALFAINGLLGGGIIIFAENIAKLMGDIQLTKPIRWLGAPFFLIPLLSISRGYFQSRENMIPTSVSQVIEQLLRVIVILLIAFIAMKYYTPYEAGISAGLGAFAGGLAGVGVMFYFWKKELAAVPSKKTRYTFPKQWKQDVFALYVDGFLVSISAMTLVVFQIVDSFTIYRFLIDGGIHEESAAVLKGIYDRGWPMIQLGAVVTTVFSYAMIPYLSKAKVRGNKEVVNELIKQSIKVCLVFGSAATVGLIVVMPHLNVMLFTDNNGIDALILLCLAVIFGALFMTAAALLHGIGRAKLAAYFLFFGLVLKGIGNRFLVPHFQITGAALSTVMSLLFISMLSIYILKKTVTHSFIHKSFWLKLGVSLLGMAAVVFAYEKMTVFFLQKLAIPITRIIHSLIAISGAFIGAILFIILIWLLQLFSKQEWEGLPKISTYLPYKNRM